MVELALVAPGADVPEEVSAGVALVVVLVVVGVHHPVGHDLGGRVRGDRLDEAASTSIHG